MPKHLITSKNPKSRSAEAFRTLRTNLQFAAIGKNVKSILVTSPNPEAGKSTIVSNLAITLAQTGKEVLIIDCDLRKPRIHKIFGVRNRSGLTNFILKGGCADDFIVDSGIQSLHIMPSGQIPPNPSELLNSERMKKLLNDVEDCYDYVLIDTPPILVVTDAQILSTLADGVVLAIPYGGVEKAELVRVKELLDLVNAKVLGAVFNKIPEDSRVSYYKKRYYGHYYSDK